MMLQEERPALEVPPRAARPQRFWRGLIVGVIASALLGGPLLLYVYREGKRRGQSDERRRQQLPERDIAAEGVKAQFTPVDNQATAAVASVAEKVTSGEAWCFSAKDCVRVVWPMEIIEEDGRARFRVRQGANRLTRPGMGLCEFAFNSSRERAERYRLLIHARYSDDCGNSMLCSLDGREMLRVGNQKRYDTWVWDRAMLNFLVKPGMHRLTIRTSEDGLEFDRILLIPVDSAREVTEEELDAAIPTPAPQFEEIAMASPLLPAIRSVEAQAFAPHSLVVAPGRVNKLSVWVRLNGAQPRDINVAVRGQPGILPQQLQLTPQTRSQIVSWDLNLTSGRSYLAPVVVDVFANETMIHSQRIDFIRPLMWAFLGPFPDPLQKGLDLELEPDANPAAVLTRPDFGAMKWKTVEDGSCYDDFGLVDLNRVYGLPTERYKETGGTAQPAVAYALTYVHLFGDHHFCTAFGGDDCVRVWHNSRPLLRVDSNVPLETSRQVVAVNALHGMNAFLFKVPQTEYAWQILFEPDGSFPYSHAEHFTRVPVDLWQK